MVLRMSGSSSHLSQNLEEPPQHTRLSATQREFFFINKQSLPQLERFKPQKKNNLAQKPGSR